MPILGSLASVVDSFALPGGISIERRTSSIVNGYHGNATVSVIAISPATVHPLVGRALLSLDEGDRTKETIQIFTRARLRTGLEGSGDLPDTVLYTPQGEAVQRRYVVKVSEDWAAQSGHYRAIATREETS